MEKIMIKRECNVNFKVRSFRRLLIMNRRFSHHFFVDLQTLCNKHRENAIGNSRARSVLFWT